MTDREDPTMGGTRRVERGNGHSYLLDGRKVQGVTSVLSDGVPKKALLPWGIGAVADEAVNRWDELAALPVATRLKELKNAPYAARDLAAKRGQDIHILGELIAGGNEVDVPDELGQHPHAYARWLDDWQVEPILTEAVVLCRERPPWPAYMGTLDMICTLGTGQRALVDLKTGKGVYGEVALQLAAYRWADAYLDDELNEHKMPQVDLCAVVHTSADGSYRFLPIDAGIQAFKQFRYAQVTAAWLEDSKYLIGQPLPVPVTA